MEFNNAGGGTITVDNNMVRMGMGTGSRYQGGTVFGIWDLGGNNRYLHNTVYIQDYQMANEGGAIAFTSAEHSSGSTVVMNNIFSGSKPANPKSYGLIDRPVSGLSFQCDYNIYYPGDTSASGARLYAWDSTFAQWQASTGFDAHSRLTNPLLVRPEGAWQDLDLHLQHGTPAESAGTASYTTLLDYDGQVRAQLTPVDIGADADNFNGVHVPPPTDTTTHDTTSAPRPVPTDSMGLVRPNGNPFSTTLTLLIASPVTGTAQISIYNFSGNLLFTLPVSVIPGDNTVQIPMAQLPDGNYLVKVDIGGKHETIQVMKKSN